MKLKSYVRRSGAGHWFLEPRSPAAVSPPGLRLRVSIKRALYAAFYKPLPGGVELRANCEDRHCILPEHQDLLPCRRPVDTEPLSLPDLEYSRTGGRVAIDQRPENLPKNVGKNTLALVEKLFAERNSLRAVCAATGLNGSEIMKLRSGVYTKALAKLARMEARRKPVRNLDDETLGKVLTKQELSTPRRDMGVLDPRLDRTRAESLDVGEGDGLEDEDRADGAAT